MKIPILGIQLDNLTEPELLKKIEDFLVNNKQHTIFTPNPEFLVVSQKDKEFKEILNQSDINIPDGFGLKLASRLLTGKKLHRHTGVDTLVKICHLASQKNKSVYFFGAGEGIAQKTAQTLKKRLPHLKVAGTESGGTIHIQAFKPASPLASLASGAKGHSSIQATQAFQAVKPSSRQSAINSQSPLSQNPNLAKINKAKPDILFVALGQVKQEKWLAQNLAKIPSIRLAMGVGGSFDYISGKIPRAPKFLRILGLEWLFRLLLNPKRAKRIWNAVVVFMWLVLKEKVHRLTN